MSRCEVCGCPDKPWLRVKEIAVSLNVCPRTVKNWIKEGKIVGRREASRGWWQVKHRSIDKMLAV